MLTAGLVSPPDSVCTSALEAIAPKYRPLAERMNEAWYEAPTCGNTVEIITSGRRKFELLQADILGAGKTVDLEYYRFADDSTGYLLHSDLVRRAGDGITIRLLYDNMINSSNRRQFFRSLKEAGCQVQPFTPSSKPLRTLKYINHRDHHKIAVIDGRIGYTGGMNLSDDYFLRWRDTHLRMEGPVVTSLLGLFEENWQDCGGAPGTPVQPGDSASPCPGGPVLQLVSSRPLTDDYPLLDSYVYALDSTQRYFYARTPYFCPPKSVMRSLRDAAQRGRDVRIILPLNSDVWFMNGANRSYFRRCVRSGVRIYLNMGVFDHSKVFVTDDYFSSIGSANLDNRSLVLNLEENVYFYDPATAVRLRNDFLRDLDGCEEVTRETIRHWPAFRKIGAALMRIFVLDL